MLLCDSPKASPTMAEPKHAGPALVDPIDPAGEAPRADILFTLPLAVVQTATASGYGLWMVLGASMALGLYPDGRGEVLVPLFTGLVLKYPIARAMPASSQTDRLQERICAG